MRSVAYSMEAGLSKLDVSVLRVANGRGEGFTFEEVYRSGGTMSASVMRTLNSATWCGCIFIKDSTFIHCELI